MPPVAEERYDFYPGRSAAGRGTLVDLIREQGATKRGILQQMAEEQNRSIREGWAGIGEGIAGIAPERRARAADKRAEAEQAREERRLAMTEEQQGWTGQEHGLRMRKGEQDITTGGLEQEGMRSRNASDKITMEGAQQKQNYGKTINPKTHKTFAEEQYGAEYEAPGLQNEGTRAGIRASDAATNASNRGVQRDALAMDLTREQIKELQLARTKEEQAVAQQKIVNTLVAAKAKGNDALYASTIAELGKVKSPAEVAVYEDAAAKAWSDRRMSENITERSSVATAGAVARAEQSQGSMATLRELANAYSDAMDQPAGGDASAIANFETVSGESIGRGLSYDHGPKVGAEPQMARILKSKMAEMERELIQLKDNPTKSKAVADQAAAIDAELNAISQQTKIPRSHVAAPTGLNRKQLTNQFLKGGKGNTGGAATPAGGPPQQRTMRGAGTTGAPAPMGAAPAPQQPTPDMFVPAGQPQQMGNGYRG